MDVFLTTEALRTTECTEKNSEISVFSVVFSDSVVPKAGSHDLLPNPQPARVLVLGRKKGTTDFEEVGETDLFT
jgi:hypothetical protein